MHTACCGWPHSKQAAAPEGAIMRAAMDERLDALGLVEADRDRLSFLVAAHGLTAVQRLNRLLDGSRGETSAEHSWLGDPARVKAEATLNLNHRRAAEQSGPAAAGDVNRHRVAAVGHKPGRTLIRDASKPSSARALKVLHVGPLRERRVEAAGAIHGVHYLGRVEQVNDPPQLVRAGDRPRPWSMMRLGYPQDDATGRCGKTFVCGSS
jgi:hypothetical protein